MRNNFKMNTPNRVIGMDAILTFGKYKGNTIRELLKIDIQYVNWLVNNPVRIHQYSKEIYKQLNLLKERT